MEVLVFGKLQLMISYIPPRHAHSSEPGLQAKAVLLDGPPLAIAVEVLGAGVNAGDSRATNQGRASCVDTGEDAAGASGEHKRNYKPTFSTR
jgi:hypothetical protein